MGTIQGKYELVRWTTNSIIQYYITLLGTFEHWKCTFAPREANNVAHLMTKEAFTSASTFYRFNNFPFWLNSSTEEDNMF